MTEDKVVNLNSTAIAIRAEAQIGVVTLNDGFYVLDGNWFRAAYGWLQVVTDAEWGEGFRSNEKWSLFIFRDADCSTLAALIPGCGVRAVAFGVCPNPSVIIFDATAGEG